MIKDLPTLKIIKEEYDKPYRIYHNNDHINRMFFVMDDQDMTLSMEQLWAIACHDVCYLPGDPLNEEKSANYATHYMKHVGFPQENIDIVQTIILDTKNHIPTIEESKPIIDLDLWDLADTERYLIGSQLVRDEYIFHLKDEGKYRHGRIEWLKKFLSRPTIFVSEYATDEMESNARKNLEAELKHLEQLGFPGCT